MLKRTPLYDQHLKLGAKRVPFAGWEMPVSYKSIIEEHNAVRNSAGLFDIGHMGLIKVEGEGALALIQKISTNDTSKLALHQCQYSILCNDKGGAVDDIMVYNLPMNYLIVCNAINAEKVLSWVKNHMGGHEHVNVSPYQNYTTISIQGPQAERICSEVLHVALTDLKRNRTLWWRDIIVSRTGYTGEDGIELIISKKEVEKIWSALINAGVQPCGLGARDTLRLEAGFPLYGQEYDEETSPLEVGYGWAVKFDKGDFIGREPLLKQKENGVFKKLVGLDIEGRGIARTGDAILSMDSKLVGKVTSGTFSPTLKKPIALAFLDPPQAEAGNSVSIEIRGRKIPAKVVAKTFFKR